MSTIYRHKLMLTGAIVASSALSGMVSDLLAGNTGFGSRGASPSGVSAIAQNYVIRMQERVKQADEAAIRGSQLYANGDYEGALDQYLQAIELLPEAPMTEQRRQAYVKQFSRAAVKQARLYADGGRYPEAIALVEEVLQPGVAPDNIAAKQLLEQLNDPNYYNPALTQAHLERVRRVREALTKAQGHIDYGDYDRAEKEYYSALNNDRYNSAARRGMENMERHRMDYYESAYNHTRAKFLREVAESWEDPVPEQIDVGTFSIGTNEDTLKIRSTETKLKTIMIPSMEFVDTPLRDAIEFLAQRSVDLDDTGSPVSERGVNIVFGPGVAGSGGGADFGAPADGDGFDDGGGGASDFGGGGSSPADQKVTLRLSNVPLAEALRYTASLAGLKYKVEPHAVVVVPISTPDADLVQSVYTVPPNFLSAGAGGDGGAGPADPFAAPAAADSGPKRLTAREVLEQNGIQFAPGASAIYVKSSSKLVVRNTPDQMELIEAFIEGLIEGGTKQIMVTSRFIEISETDSEELGFDWMLGPFNIGATPRVFGTGGTVGSASGFDASQNFAFQNPAGGTVGRNPVTAGLRSGFRAIDRNSIDNLIRSDVAADPVTPAAFSIAGVFTDPQFQVAIRALNQRKGVDLLSAPSVMVRSGEQAKVEVIREFIYPTEYDPPEIPNTVQSAQQQGIGGSSFSTFPVTPATPTAFDTRNTGVILDVNPILGPDGYTIDLNLAPEVVEFEGFINYGSPISSAGTNALGVATTFVITENRIEMPVFNTRRVTTQVTIWDGQTVALGGLIRHDIQDVEDKIPFIGDLPVAGRLFRNNVEFHIRRNLTVFVKAVLVDPAGVPVRNRIEDDPEPAPIEPRRRINTTPTYTPPPALPYYK
ncbi:MAG: Amuc_1098 family type IV pilus outer membrane protein, partial [Verrucomicrobiota bacterium]